MYTRYFGFTEKPFNVTPDPRFLYLSPSHQEALASMIYGIKERRGFISIIGEIGTGKTTLLHTLFRELGDDVKTVFIFNTKINFMQLLQNILIELELTPVSNNKALLLNQLNDYLIERLALNENVALIIDEAQNLSTDVLEELRMLSNLETPREKLLQIVLVGQPELDFKLRSPALRQLKQRIGINCYLTPLNYDEQMKYIAHRLSIAGFENDTIFSPGAIKLICKHSKGIPRIINIFCDNALLTAYGRQQQRIDIATVKEVISDYEQSKLEPREEVTAAVVQESKSRRSFAKMAFNSLLVLLIFLLLLLVLVNYQYIAGTLDQLTTAVKSQIDAFLAPREQVASDTDPAAAASVQAVDIAQPINKEATVSHAPSPVTVINEAAVDKTPNNEPTADAMQTRERPSEEAPSPAGETALVENAPDGLLQKTVTAKKGDSVSALVLKEYGALNDTICDIVKRTNPGLEDLDMIYIGQTINLPQIGYEDLLVNEDKGTYSLHVATFSSYRQAEQFINTALDKDYPFSIKPVAIVGRQPWHRVTVGDFTNRSEAIAFAKSFKSYNLPYSILKE